MTKYQALTIYALLIIATGSVLSSLAYYPTRAIQYIVAIGILSSAVFTFATAFKMKNSQIPMNYHALHAIGMIIYGLAILFWANDIEVFFNITIFFLLYYGMAEIIFCFQLFELKQQNINSQIILYRFLIGLSVTIGAIYILASHNKYENSALLVAGVVFAFSGLYLLKLKTVLTNADKMNSLSLNR